DVMSRVCLLLIKRCTFSVHHHQEFLVVFFFSSRRRHTRSKRDWSSDVCSSDLSSSKSPVSCTSPLVMGISATMVFSILACQIRTVQWPFSGILSLFTRPDAIAKAPTAAVKLPQLPLQSIKGLSMDTWPNK